MNDKKLMNRAADNIRILAASMVEKAKSGHPGGSMGGADFVNVLFSEFLVYDPENPRWEGRDRFFLDPGHMSPMLYSTLALTGKYTLEELKQFRQWGSPTPGHPEVDIMRGIENTSGPLGQGHTFAVGAAIAAKFLKARFNEVMNQTIYAFISDGGVQEEISQGAGRVAGTLGLDNLIMFYDANDIQLSTETKDVTVENTAMKYEAWGWKVISINGNDPDEIRAALKEAQAEKERPTLIIGKTIMGKGARRADGTSYEACCATHGAPLGGDAYINTIKNLNGDPENPFVIFPEVAELYAKRKEELKKIVAERYAVKEAWAKANPELAAKLEFFFSGQAPKIDWSSIEQKANVATRVASATVLSLLATQVENMIVASADLSNSDKTDGFLKKTHAFTKGDFSGAFFQAGVAELTMACICIGYVSPRRCIGSMRYVLRILRLHETGYPYGCAHGTTGKICMVARRLPCGRRRTDTRTGGTGSQIRLMEKLKNHKGNNSMLVLRPADAEETTVAWKLAMENMSTPTGLIFSRQNVNNLPEGTPYEEAVKGAYTIAGADENSGMWYVGGFRFCKFLRWLPVPTAPQRRRKSTHRISSFRRSVPQSAERIPRSCSAFQR